MSPRAAAVVIAAALLACRRPGEASPGGTAATPASAAAAAAPVLSTARRLASTMLPLAARDDAPESGGTASVTGVVAWSGSAPLKIKQLTNEVDAGTCGERVSPGAVVAGPGDVLANVVVELRRLSDERRLPSEILAAPGERAVVEIERCLQVPHVLVVPLGAEVEVINRDGILHELAGISVRNPPFFASLPRYRRSAVIAAQELARPERIRVTCEVHPWAVSWWVVTGARHHAVTGRDGRFRMDGVGAGTWRLVAWHEELGEIRRTVDVRSGSAESVELAFR